MSKFKIAFAIAFYVQTAFLTGAYRHNNVEDDYIFRIDSDLSAGIFWPVYWNARFVLWVTK